MAASRDQYLPGRPFRLAAGLSAGLTRREIDGPSFRRVFHGIHVAAGTPDTVVVRARAARLAIPRDAVFSHWTAWSLWTPGAPTTSRIHVSFGRNAFVKADGVSTHRFTGPVGAVYRHGLPVTSAPQTLVHMAIHLDLVHLVGLGDTLVRRSGMSPGELRASLRDWTGHGSAGARAAARFVRSRVDSLPESRLRMLLVLAGLPEPVVNHSVLIDGVERFRLDLAYVDQMLAIEYDGRWHDHPEQQVKDRRRRRTLRCLGWTIVVIKADDLFADPEGTLAKIVEALCAAGVPCPPRLSDDYRPFFMPSWSVANAALLEGERQAELEDQPLLVVNEGWVSTTVEN